MPDWNYRVLTLFSYQHRLPAPFTSLSHYRLAKSFLQHSTRKFLNMEKAFFLLKSIKLYHVINLPDIRFMNNAVLHLNNFIPILRLLETTFLYSQILEKMGYVSFIQFHSIRLSRMSHNFVFFFFFLSFHCL